MADDKNNHRVVLYPYSMLAVELESSSGEKLQVQHGNVATLAMPIPSALAGKAPAAISLWYTDELTGIWKEQGTAQKTGSTYVGEVKHFSYWNCDIGLPAIAFSATFKTSEGLPLNNLYVSIRVADSNNGYAHGYTDSLGQVAGLVTSNKNLVMEVHNDCYEVVYSKNIGPFTQNTDLGTTIITVPLLVTIKGKLISCNNLAVSNGYAQVYWNNYLSYVNTDADGKFSISFLACLLSSQSFDIIGVDTSAKQQGPVTTISITSQTIDAGNIDACGISTEQFIKYKMDDREYKIASSLDSSTDFLSFYNYTDSASSSLVTFIEGAKGAGNVINFDFAGKGFSGTYPLNSLSVATCH